MSLNKFKQMLDVGEESKRIIKRQRWVGHSSMHSDISTNESSTSIKNEGEEGLFLQKHTREIVSSQPSPKAPLFRFKSPGLAFVWFCLWLSLAYFVLFPISFFVFLYETGRI